MQLDHPRFLEFDALLVKLGLNTTERKVYLTGLVSGPSTIVQLALKAEIKRLTVHQAVASLIDMGVFLESYYGKKRLVYPHSIDGLVALVEEKKFALRQLEQHVDASKSLFTYITANRSSFPSTRLYQGVEGINTTLLEMARDHQPVLTMYDAHALTTIVDEKLFHRSYLQRSIQHISTKLIVPDNFRDYRHIERKEDYDISLRCVSPTQIIQGGIDIRGSKVALHCYQEGFITTTIIDNIQIAQMMTVMYQAMRTSARDYHEQYVLV